MTDSVVFSDKKGRFQIAFGSSAPRISEQLKSQGFGLKMTPLEKTNLDQDARTLDRLYYRKILTEFEIHIARRRIFRVIEKNFKPLSI